jgi:hypothetical protein
MILLTTSGAVTVLIAEASDDPDDEGPDKWESHDPLGHHVDSLMEKRESKSSVSKHRNR